MPEHFIRKVNCFYFRKATNLWTRRGARERFKQALETKCHDETASVVKKAGARQEG